MNHKRMENQRFDKLRFQCQTRMRELRDNPDKIREFAPIMSHLTDITVSYIRKVLQDCGDQELMEKVDWAEAYLRERCEELSAYTSFEGLSPEGQDFFGTGEDKVFQEMTEPVDLPPFLFKFH